MKITPVSQLTDQELFQRRNWLLALMVGCGVVTYLNFLLLGQEPDAKDLATTLICFFGGLTLVFFGHNLYLVNEEVRRVAQRIDAVLAQFQRRP